VEFETAHNDLLSREDARALRVQSDTRGSVHLLLHLLCLAIAVLLNAASFSFLTFFATMLQGVMMVTLFAPLHETVHRTAFEDREINDWVGRLIGLILFLPAGYFRQFHFAHHRYTQVPGKDPELALTKPKNKVDYVVWMSGLHYWQSQVVYLLSASFGRLDADFISYKRRDDVILEARIHVAIYLVMFVVMPIFGVWGAYWFWLFPLFLGQPFLRAYLFAEHGGLEETGDLLANTRTIITNPVVRFLMWNMPYHTEHHIYPAVPFHLLPKLHEQIEKHLRFVDNGYIEFHREFWRELD
jgi:fatty acid desaturase